MTKVNSLTKKDSALETKLSDLQLQVAELKAKVKLNTFDLAFSLKLHNWILFSIQIETTTTTTTTTAAPPALPAGCEDYKWLNNPKRKTTYSTPSGEWKCDKSGQSHTTSDWQGPGWYRISPSIGTKIPTSPTEEDHCGTATTGWISGGSTPGLGQTINAKACFVSKYFDNDCYWSSNVEIRNCRDYLLYYLPDTPADCYLSYCVE